MSLALLITRTAFQASGLSGGSRNNLRGSTSSSSATGVGLSSGLGPWALSDSLVLPPSPPHSIPS
eukprot:1694605-Pyramimonas_sp.AAC.1